MKRHLGIWVLASAALACGDDQQSTTASGSADGTDGLSTETSRTSGEMTTAVTSGADASAESGDGSHTSESATTTGGTQGLDDSASGASADSTGANDSDDTTGTMSGGTVSDGMTSDGTTSDGTTSDGTMSSSGDDGDDATTGGNGVCPGNGIGILDFSYIWIANSTQGTVSKIDTVTATEVGRYLVDDYEGQTLSNCQGPSRTSVNLEGDVAVLDRSGGLAKIIADVDNCPDLNNNNVIDTATDANFLPWGDDECVAWQISVPKDPGSGGCGGPRAVQWTAPTTDENCVTEEPRIWISFCNENDNDATVWLVNGSDGSIEEQYAVPGYGCSTYGPYGGAVDEENNFWFVDRNAGQSLYRVEYGCVPMNPGDCVTEYTQPAGLDAYGITIDPQGRLWMAGSNNSVFNYDPTLDAWTSIKDDVDLYFANNAPADSNTNNTLRGLMIDESGVMWIASISNGAWNGGSNPGLLRIDPAANPIEIDFYGPSTLTGIEHAAGVSIDYEGYVWLVDTLGDQAFKIDPVTINNFTVVGGLQFPYTYSDMTGFALQQIIPQ
jgi:hypothetical protein